jgi:hypothetical protein
VIDTFNKFMVGVDVGSGKIMIPNLRPEAKLSNEEAVNLAAWLLALSGRPAEEFERTYEEICNS